MSVREVEVIRSDDDSKGGGTKAVRRRADQGFELISTHFEQPSKAGEQGVVVFVMGRSAEAREARAAANAERKAAKGKAPKKTTAKKTTAKKTTAKK